MAFPITLERIFVLNIYIHREVIHEIDELLVSELMQVKEQLRPHATSVLD